MAAARAVAGTAGLLVDPPEIADRASLKLHQIEIALSLGLCVPRSVFTNDSAFAQSVLDRSVRNVAKPVSSGVGIAPFTDFLDAGLFEQFSACPTLAQEYLDPIADVRVVTVGMQAFVWERPKPPAEGPDWRRWDPEGLGFRRSMDVDQESDAIAVATALGLTFSVQDWLRLSEGRAFLEVNPRGSWLFLDGSECLVVPELVRHLTTCEIV